MAGIADALASVLYPYSADKSLYTIGGKGVLSAQMPMWEKGWQNALASGLQGIIGQGLQGYGQLVTNQANAEAASKMIPQLSSLGVTVSPDIQEGLASEDPQKRALALALTERQITQADAVRKSDAEFADFKRKEVFKDSLDDDKRATESARNLQAVENQLRGEVNQLQPKKTFEIADQYFKASVNSALKNDKGSDLSLISNLAKMRDPTSVVREGEVSLTSDTQSYLDKVAGDWRAVLGGSRLGPEGRALLLQNAKDYWDAARQAYELQASQYEKLAQARGLPAKNVIMLPYSAEAYAPFVSSIPSAESIQKAFQEQANQQQLAAIPTRSATIGQVTLQSPETRQAPALPPLAPDQEYRQIGPDTYIRVQKGK